MTPMRVAAFAIVLLTLMPRPASSQVGSASVGFGTALPEATPGARGPSAMPVRLISGNQCIHRVADCRHFLLDRSGGTRKTRPTLRYAGDEVKTRLATNSSSVIDGAWIRVCARTLLDVSSNWEWEFGCRDAPELPLQRSLDGERTEHFDDLDVKPLRDGRLLYLGWSREPGKPPVARSVPFELEIK